MPGKETLPSRKISAGYPLWLALLASAAHLAAQPPLYGPLTRSNFVQVVGPNAPVPQGFGDRQNSWAWSMAWFQGKLVVGTARSYDCMVQASLNRQLFGLIPYPPLDPDESCAPQYVNLPLQAEIWTWTPQTNVWQRVFQAPQNVPIPGAPGKFVSSDVGYRYMYVYQEPEGDQALYISGLGPKFIYGSGVPNGRLLRTTDLVNFQAIPQDPGTVLGNLNNAGWRGITSYNGNFFGIAGSIEGDGTVLESSDPKLGDNSFKVILPAGETCSELLPYNGYLYLSLQSTMGFRVVKTNAVESSPGAGYTFQEIIPYGGGRTDSPNQDVWSMKVFNNRLYIGGNGVQSFLGSEEYPLSFVGAELYRINPDDSWDLLVGQPRTVNGVLLTPLSGLDAGFNWGFNAHMWRQEVYDGRLYIGTFDASTILKNIPFFDTLLAPYMGADLFYSDDGVYYYPVDQQGFQDKFNFGFRTLLNTAYGLFVGTANYYYGLQIFQGQPTGSTPTANVAPKRLEAEYSSGRVLLSWDQPSAGGKYRVLRYTHAPADERPNSPQIPGSLQTLGTTEKPYFSDSNIQAGSVYSYVVVNDRAGPNVLAASNYAMYPIGRQPITFGAATAYIQNCQKRGCFTSDAAYQFMLNQYSKAASVAVTKGDIAQLAQLVLTVKGNFQQGAAIMKATAAEDLELQLTRLVRRFMMYQAGYLKLSDL